MKQELSVRRYPGIIEWLEKHNIAYQAYTYSLFGDAGMKSHISIAADMKPKISSVLIDIEEDSPEAVLFVLRWS